MKFSLLNILKKAFFIFIVALISFYLFWISPRYSVPVLTYHSVSVDKGLLSVSARNFERQMRYLKEG